MKTIESIDGKNKIGGSDESNLSIKVGILYSNFSNGIVRPDVPNRFENIFIERKNINGAPFGMRVVCLIIEEGVESTESEGVVRDEFTGTGMPKGKIVEVLGDPVTNDATMNGIMIAHNLKADFPESVLEQVQQIPDEMTLRDIEKELARGRKDLRGITIVTIDGEDTKDIDDGLSITKTDDKYILGVHIADVAHYVREGSEIDKEALKRGTSVYLADRVIPMLPSALSNNLCSLNPGKPRFALSVTLEYDLSAELISFDVQETIIESKDRLTYKEVTRLLSGEGSVPTFVENYKEMLGHIHVLSRILREKRFAKGAINFEFTETKLEMNANKIVTDIHAAESTFANEMIEECMVACNEAIAKHYEQKKGPFIYRTHKMADPDKIQALVDVSGRLGEKIRLPATPSSQDIQQLITRIQDRPYKETFLQMILRSMPKAEYTDVCQGHFGLALKYYCHFTSPIRRYPDLFIHRVIKGDINRQPSRKKWMQIVKSVCDQCSDNEKNSMIAERESVDYKIAEYMKNHIGETFDGTVSGIQSFGVFIRLTNTAEGLAPFRTMRGYYEYFEEQMIVRLSGTRKTIRIGDKVRVKIISADLIARRIEISLEEDSLQIDSNTSAKKTTMPSKTRKFGKSKKSYKGNKANKSNKFNKSKKNRK